MQEIATSATGDLKIEIDREIGFVNAGIYGENNIAFELRNSHIPMMILHDLYLTEGDLSAQIDYLLVTRGCVFVVECKNLIGNIEINRNGDFIRTMQINGHTKKEGLYSPVTQNRRHLDLIKIIRGNSKRNILEKALFERDFNDVYRSVVVLANPKTILNDRYAPKEIRKQVIRADQLAEYIRKCNSEENAPKISENSMVELAQFFMSQHKEQITDYTAKYRTALTEPVSEERNEPEKGTHTEICCPKCGAPMIKRKATKGENAGKEFYGCSRFPQCKGIINI